MPTGASRFCFPVLCAALTDVRLRGSASAGERRVSTVIFPWAALSDLYASYSGFRGEMAKLSHFLYHLRQSV